MKRKLLLVLVIILAAVFCLSAFACEKPPQDENLISENDNLENDNPGNNNPGNNNPGNNNPENDNPISQDDDDGYVLEIEGIGAEVINITKTQIRALAATKLIEYTEDEPCFASDKTDDSNNPIPHTLKGVYLDDLLAEYANGAIAGYFSAMVLKGSDGYETQLMQETFSEEHGGTKMIIAYEYDGHVLNPTAKSGALRAVFPDQVANSWAKMLEKIIFTDAEFSPPIPTTLNFVELLGEGYNSSFTKDITTGNGTSAYTFYGISLAKLFEDEILVATAADKMYLRAWDYVTDGTQSFNREYTNWKSSEYYSDAYLVYSYKIADGEKQPENNAPGFDGANILKGMTVKNVLSLSVKNTALVCLDMAYDRYDTDLDDTINISEVLGLVNMMNDKNTYTITSVSDIATQLSSATLATAKLVKTQSGYELHYDEQRVNIKSISI